MARILLIDDDMQVLKLMTAFLEQEHHEISIAVDGFDGIRQLKSQQFDLVITDVIMPEEDGIGVLISLMGQANSPKVIAISGGSALLDQNQLLETCHHLGASKVLPKPVDFKTLTNAVREVLEG